MFDAAAASDAAHAVADTTAAAPVLVRAADAAQNGGRLEVVFIDSSVPEWQKLVSSVKAGVEIEVIDSSKDGLSQIAAWAQSHSGYDAIALLSHGGTGWFAAGSATVNAASLSDAGIGRNLTQLGQALKSDGSLLLYGCDVAQGDSGAAFLSALGGAVGRSVSASTDDTGGMSVNGDWVLEASFGLTYSYTPMVNAPDWNHILAAPAINETFTAQNGLSSSWTYLRSGWSGTYLSSTYGAILTNNGNNQSADLIYNNAFDSSAGVDVRFTYYMGPNSSGADGLSFFLLDGTTNLVTSFNVGAVGPGLGYAANGTEQGISGGVLGVGIDLWGNYSGSAAGTNSPGPLNSNGATYSGNIVVRGSGDEATSTTGYKYLTGTQPDASGNPRAPGAGNVSYLAGTHTVEVVLAVNGTTGHYELTVKLDNISQISGYDLTANGVSVPSTLMFGFGASTGGATNIQSIKSVSVFTAAAAADAAWPTFTSTTPTAISVDSNAATNLASYLHVSDTDSGQTLTWSQYSAPSHGTLTFTGATAATGSSDVTPGGVLTYTPNAGYTGTDTFTVMVSDGTTWSTKTITVTVNDVPTFTSGTSGLTIDANSGAVDISGLLKVSDQDSGQTLTWSASSAPAHGTLSITGATASTGSTSITPGGTLTYTPAADFQGTDTFTIQVSDGVKTVQQTITVTVRGKTVSVSPVTPPNNPSPSPNVSSPSVPTSTPDSTQSTTTMPSTPTVQSVTSAGTPDGLNNAAAGLSQGTTSTTPSSTGGDTSTTGSAPVGSGGTVTGGAQPSLGGGGESSGTTSDATAPVPAATGGDDGGTAAALAGALAAGTLPSGTGTSQAGNDAYTQALTNALAQGRSLSDAVSLAQQAAATQASADAAAGDPNAALAAGGDVTAALGADAGSSLYQQALGSALARGVPLAQAIASAQAAVQGLSSGSDPAVALAEALASGRAQGLTAGLSDAAAASFQKTLSGALARGASVAEALSQAQSAAGQADALNAAANNNALGDLASGGKRAGAEGVAYDRALSAALAAGLPLDVAQARARDAARALAAATGQRFTEADALASGRRVDEVLGARAKDPIFMTAFNRALAAGKDVRLALAEAEKAARQARTTAEGSDRLPEALATGKQVDPAKVPHSGDLSGPSKALFDRVLGRVLQGGAPLDEAVKRANAAVAEFQATENAAANAPQPLPPRASASR